MLYNNKSDYLYDIAILVQIIVVTQKLVLMLDYIVYVSEKKSIMSSVVDCLSHWFVKFRRGRSC